MPEARKKPCRICQRWFYPDPRVGKRQRACGNPDCQTARRQKTQARWRTRNPSYAAAYRIDQRQGPPVEPLRVPAPLDKLPWDLAENQFGPEAADFIGVVCLLLLRLTKDQCARYPIDPNSVPDNNSHLQRKRPDPNRRILRPAPQALEFQQLDRRLEHLRVRHPASQRRLIAWLAETGQQTPIIVIQQDISHLVIDGHKRIAALQTLGRDTVQAECGT